jgi:glycosyltransferase involved in cell wall biosynthesis
MKKAINIMFVINNLSMGGSERQMIELIKGVDKDRFNPIVVCFEKGEGYTSYLKKSGIPIFYAERKWRFDPFVIGKLRQLIRQHNIDIVHTYLAIAGLYGPIAARLENLPVVNSFIRGGHSKLDLYKSTLAKIGFRYSDVVVANYEGGKRIYDKLAPGKIRIIYNGVDPTRFVINIENIQKKLELGVKVNNFIITMISRLEMVKNPELLIRVASIVLKELPNVTFLLVGDGSMKKDLIEMIQRADLKKNILMLGLRNDIEEILKITDIGILTSKEEGLSNAIIEMLMSGTPVVATDSEGTKEIMGQVRTGLLVKRNDEFHMASEIIRLLKNEPLRQEMGEVGRKSALECFELNLMVKKHEDIYEELVTKFHEKTATNNIMFIINNLSIGGAERQMIELLKGINKDRYNPIVVCFEKKDGFFSNVASLNIPIFYTERKWRFDPFVIEKLRKLIREQNINIVHTYLTIAGLYGPVAAWLEKVPVINSYIRGGNKKPNLYQSINAKIGFLFSDVVLANYEAGKKRYEKLAPEKIQVIYNAMDPARFAFDIDSAQKKMELGIPVDNFVITMMARLEPLKNPEMVIRVARIVLKDKPNTTFLFVGDGSMKNILAKSIENSGLKKNIFILGPRHDTEEILKITDVGILTSDEEGLSNAIIEMLMSGVPVIATDSEGTIEILNYVGAGLLVKRNDEHHMASEIIRLLKNEPFRLQTAEAGRKSALERFDIRQMVQRHVELYEELLDKVHKQN